MPLQLDVTSDELVEKAADTADDVDVLVNNAGTMAFGDWVTSPQEVIDADMNTNFYGTLRVIRAFAPSSSAVGQERLPTWSALQAWRRCRCWPVIPRRKPRCNR